MPCYWSFTLNTGANTRWALREMRLIELNSVGEIGRPLRLGQRSEAEKRCFSLVWNRQKTKQKQQPEWNLSPQRWAAIFQQTLTFWRAPAPARSSSSPSSLALFRGGAMLKESPGRSSARLFRTPFRQVSVCPCVPPMHKEPDRGETGEQYWCLNDCSPLERRSLCLAIVSQFSTSIVLLKLCWFNKHFNKEQCNKKNLVERNFSMDESEKERCKSSL